MKKNNTLLLAAGLTTAYLLLRKKPQEPDQYKPVLEPLRRPERPTTETVGNLEDEMRLWDERAHDELGRALKQASGIYRRVLVAEKDEYGLDTDPFDGLYTYYAVVGSKKSVAKNALYDMKNYDLSEQPGAMDVIRIFQKYSGLDYPFVNGCGNIRYNNSLLARDNDGYGEDEMYAVKLKDLKGDVYFKLRPTDTAPVWVKDEYDRSERKYLCHKFDGNGERYIKGDTVVYAGFYF